MRHVTLLALVACSSPAKHVDAGGTGWAPVTGGWTGVPCEDGLLFSADGSALYGCTTDAGFLVGQVSGTAVTWHAANTGIDNLAGAAIATHPISPAQLAYVAQPAGWFRSGDTATTWTPITLSKPYPAYVVRLQPMVGNMLGTWDGGAVVLTGFTGPVVPHAVATATGEVRAFAASGANDIFAAVLGQTPDGGTATGGVFHSIDGAATWTELDAGIADADKPLVGSIVMDPEDPTDLFAALRGGGQIYRSTDSAQTWTRVNTGLPADAGVVMIAFTSSTLYAATTMGLYTSNDGASWSLAGFAGTSVRAVAISGSLVVAAVEDAAGLYSRL